MSTHANLSSPRCPARSRAPGLDRDDDRRRLCVCCVPS